MTLRRAQESGVTVIVSVSPQSRASLAEAYDLTPQQVRRATSGLPAVCVACSATLSATAPQSTRQVEVLRLQNTSCKAAKQCTKIQMLPLSSLQNMHRSVACMHHSLITLPTCLRANNALAEPTG